MKAKIFVTVLVTILVTLAVIGLMPNQIVFAKNNSSNQQSNFEEWMETANILVYEDMAGDYSVYRYISSALDDMGLRRYVDVKDAGGHFKNQLLSGGPGGEGWDLIISGKERRRSIQGEFYVYITDALDEGSSVIVEEWDMDGIASGKISMLLSRCGVKFQEDWIDDELNEHPLFPVDGEHDIHHVPNDGVFLTNPTGFWLGTDLGDKMKLTPGSEAIPLWSNHANAWSENLMAVECVDGRLIIQTYSSHSYGQNRVVLMWQNYIYNALQARYVYLGLP